MIDLFTKLSRENHLKSSGHLLDLGCGSGARDVPFAEFGYKLTLVDKDPIVLANARDRFKNSETVVFVESPLESFAFTESFDGITAINSLPFVGDKDVIAQVVSNAYHHLKPGGFLYFTLFGLEDEWARKDLNHIAFFSSEEASNIIEQNPYFTSEDKGYGATMKGDSKFWHNLHFLYIKD